MLLIGPPGSGKTHYILTQIDAAIREGRGGEARLVVPTVSMARHTLHTLARRGAAVPSGMVATVADFTVGLTPEVREPSPALSAWLLEQAIRESSLAGFSILGAAGAAVAAARSMREFWAVGSGAEQAAPLAVSPEQKAFADVFLRYQERLEELGFVSPWQRFQAAAERIRAGYLAGLREVYFDGFFHLTAGERELIQASEETIETTVAALLENPRPPLEGLAVRRLKKIHRPAIAPAISEAATPTHEIEETARAILGDLGCNKTENASFARYGVVLRSPEVYAPIVRRVFERFGIPFRMQRAKPLAAQGGIRFLAALLRVVEEGFPAEETVEAMRRPACAAGDPAELDAFDFAVRRKLPGRGLAFLETIAKPYPSVARRLVQLRDTAAWPRESLPPGEWAEHMDRFQREWRRRPEVDGEAAGLPSYDRVLAWRAAAQAAPAFSAAAEEAASLLSLSGETRASFSAYLQALEFVLRRTSTSIADRRRNVVHVLSIFEARQWELPVVFVPGLVEGQFPSRAERGLFFNETDRERLRRRGIALRSAEERDAEERLLFRVASTRAREKLFLSYARLDEQGRPLLRSFLLGSEKKNDRVLLPVRLREPAPDYTVPGVSHLLSPELRRWVAAGHESFSPTSLERFLQCPFQYFALRTLGLEEPPLAPEKRLDARVEGSIVHRTLAQWSHDRSRPVSDVLREVFEQERVHYGVLPGFQALAAFCRLEQDIKRFCGEKAAGAIPEATSRDYEANFQYLVERGGEDDFLIRGRIDRYEVLGQDYAFVVDYKYSRGERIRKLVEDYDQGSSIQGPLYLLGLEQELGLRPAGMQFWGLRGEVTRRGWIVKGRCPEALIQGKDIEVSENNFRGILHQGLERATQAVDEIRAGRIEVAPRDRDECNSRCHFRDLCRIRL